VGQAITVEADSVMFGLGKSTPASAQGHLSGDLGDDKRRFEVIFNSIEDGVILIDHEGVVQLINPGASAITGWPSEDATGINVQQVMKLVDDKGQPKISGDNLFEKIFNASQTLRDNDGYIVTREGKQLSISFSLTPLVDNDDRVSAAVVIFRDVSLERAEERQRADFISTASHEMRTPVAAIEGYLALALNEKVATIDARARDYLEKAHSSTQHLGQLFQDLLTSAKAEDGRLTSHPAVMEIGAFLEQLSNDLRFAAEKKGLAMEFKVGSSASRTIDATQENATGSERVVRPLFYVYADADRLREVITNLFDNAVKYTPDGMVTIGLTGDEQVVQCYVKDTGPGIPSEDVPHLFQKFYRVDNSATRTIGGTGLGLFICRKIVELYNGRIWVESELGKGSSFYINLPRLSAEKARQLQTQTTAASGAAVINSAGTT
jgi:PAS domain S-box-containing protein